MPCMLNTTFRVTVHLYHHPGPYHHDPQPAPRAADSCLGRPHGASREGPVASSVSLHHNRVEHHHHHHQQHGDFGEDELHHSFRSADGAQGGQPAREEFLHTKEGNIRPLFERGTDVWNRDIGCSSSKGSALQTRSPGWQGQSRQSNYAKGSPHSDVADGVMHRSVEPRPESLGGDRSPHRVRTLNSAASSTSRSGDPVVMRDAQPKSLDKLVQRELHRRPHASPDYGSPNVMRHQPEPLLVRSVPLSHREAQESVPASWEKMPLDDVVRMEGTVNLPTYFCLHLSTYI